MDRIDNYPTHTYGNYKLRVGEPMPYGATFVPGGVNFSIFSRHATGCTLVLFDRDADVPRVEIPFPEEFRIGDVYTMIVFDLDHETMQYGYRLDGPYQPRKGHRFNPDIILLDPYAKAIAGREIWGVEPGKDNIYPHRARLVYKDFDWEHDIHPRIPMEDLIIYEMHVRGFTQHPSSGVRYPGTFAAIREKIPYLLDLGVNCIELMPIFEFDEFENTLRNPHTDENLYNYWGYSTIGFFAPKAGYAATGQIGMQVDEFKTLIKDLHRIGIEVILDVVFNHTAEGNEYGHTISFRGIDNKVYYMLAPDGSYVNYSGTGNTLNCNHPVVRDMVIGCLRYWASEYHIDGFRFDLASILGRDQDGSPLRNPPLIESLAHDPILADCKLIAEAWDAGGLYQVGTFPAYGRWAEWNGKYRDVVRKFIKGDPGMTGEMGQRLMGSPDMYHDRARDASVNFITCHDGFTLRDLFSYNEKHNWANGENNRDGANDNYSWNCGIEGETDDPEINALRERMTKNAIAILMVSQGIPMLLMGDEIGHTKFGNNNTYCHDNELNWFNWQQLHENAGLHRFFRHCINFRKMHEILRGKSYLGDGQYGGAEYIDVSWHGTQAWHADWSHHSRELAFMLAGKRAINGRAIDDYIYVAMNMYWEGLWFELPELPTGWHWRVFANTGMPSPQDICEPDFETRPGSQKQILVGPRSVLILVGHPQRRRKTR